MNKRRKKVGYLVKLLMFTYLAVGIGVILAHKVLAGVLYIVLISTAFLIIAYAWCARCPCWTGACTHIWFGSLYTCGGRSNEYCYVHSIG
jgi:hypothetical protein